MAGDLEPEAAEQQCAVALAEHLAVLLEVGARREPVGVEDDRSGVVLLAVVHQAVLSEGVGRVVLLDRPVDVFPADPRELSHLTSLRPPGG